MLRKLLLLLTLLLALCVSVIGCAKEAKPTPQLKLGIERIGEPEVSALLQGKRLGLFTNQSGVDRELRSSVELVSGAYDLRALFVPEHGLFGAVAAGESFASSEYHGIPVFSLYGDTRRPTREMLEGIDAILIDIQDVGVRHYTYFSSLAYIMEECAKNGKQVIVLDRPNPLGNAVQGPVLKEEWATFIGLYPIPLRHGLTIGEFARYINREQGIGCELEVVPMLNYNAKASWQATGLPWVQTSPRIPTMETAYMYGITGCLGNANLSVGIGTGKPFHFIGAPFMDAERVKQAFTELNIKGLRFRAAAFTPEAGNYQGETAQGVELYLTDREQVNLPEAGYLLLSELCRLYPEQITFRERGYNLPGYVIDTNLGESSVREGAPAAATFARWREEDAAFAKLVRPYKLY